MSASTDSPLLGRYRVLRRLGTGGMATVYLAEDERLGRRVAVKRLHAESPDASVRRLEREARVGASLNHRNIVAVYDTGTDEEGVLLVMEHVDGENLAAALSGGRLPPDRAMEIVRAVAAALDHAHAAGVVHRDVKPANVLLGQDGAVKLVDLGIAQAAEQTRLTLTGSVLGTASYMAPEQLQGGRVGPGVDTCALAAVAFEALSGQKARRGGTPVEVAHRVTSEPPPDLREAWQAAPQEAAAALARGMSRDPGDRQRFAGELARELSDAMEHSAGPPAADGTATAATATSPEPGPPVSGASVTSSGQAARRAAGPPTRHGRSGRRRSLGATAAVALLAIAVGAVLVTVLSAGGSGEDPTGEAPVDSAPAEAQGASGAEGGEPAPADAAPASEPAPTESAEEPASVQLFAEDGTGDPQRGAELNEQGKSLIDQGRPGDAVPVLQDALASFPEGTTDIQYAFSLYNLGNALRLSGRAEDAIPVLERRLAIPDQRDVVRAELRRARAEAAGG